MTDAYAKLAHEFGSNRVMSHASGRFAVNDPDLQLLRLYVGEKLVGVTAFFMVAKRWLSTGERLDKIAWTSS